MPLWLVAYLLIGAVVGGIYGMMLWLALEIGRSYDWQERCLAGGVGIALVFIWPLWLVAYLCLWIARKR